MIFELMGLISLIILAILFFAEVGKQPTLGLFAAVLLLILGYWLLTDNIQIQAGSIEATTQNLTTSSSSYILSTNATQTYPFNSTIEQANGTNPFSTIGYVAYTPYKKIATFEFNPTDGITNITTFTLNYRYYLDDSEQFVYFACKNDNSGLNVTSVKQTGSVGINATTLNCLTIANKTGASNYSTWIWKDQYVEVYNSNYSITYNATPVITPATNITITNINTTGPTNTTITTNYTNIPSTSFMPLNQLLGLIFVLIGIYGMYWYSFAFKTSTN